MIRDVSIVLRGTVAAQVIGLLSLPILSRLFPPDAFGHYSVYQAAITVVTGVACLRYDMAILIAESQEDAIGLFGLSIRVALGLSIMIIPVLALVEMLGAPVSKWLGFSVLWFSLAIALGGAFLATTALLTRLALFHLSARTKLAQAASTASTTLAMGALLPSATGLVIGDLAGRAMGCLLFVAQARRHLLETWKAPKPARYYRALARRFDRFPRLSVAGGLLNNGASFLAPAAMLAIYGASIAGQFSLVDRAISLPLGMIVITLSQVFTSHFPRVMREDSRAARPYFWKVVLASAALAVIPAILGAMFAPALFVLVFGSDWEVAGHYARILALMYFMALTYGPISSSLIILNKLRWQFWWEAIRLLLLALTWATIATFHFSPEHALAVWGGVTIMVSVIYIWMVDVVLRRYARSDARLREA